MMYKFRLKILIYILGGKGHLPRRQSQSCRVPALSRHEKRGKRQAAEVGEIVDHEKCL